MLYSLNMEGDGEGWTSTDDSDSEEERELEIALYSQVHFDTAVEHAGQQKHHLIDNGNALFNVGVEEISLPLKNIAMKRVRSEQDVWDFLPHSPEHSRLRGKLEHAGSADTIYITSSDDDASVEIISSGTIQYDSNQNRNQTDDECVFLEMLTSKTNKTKSLTDEGNRKISLEKKLSTSDCNTSLNKSAKNTLDEIIPISDSPRDKVCGQNSREDVSTTCEQRQGNDINDDDVLILDEYIQLEDSLLLTESSKKSHLIPEETMNEISQNEIRRDSQLDKKHLSSDMCPEPPHACQITSEKPKESCYTLPFTITKVPVLNDKKPSSGESDSMEDEASSTKLEDTKKLIGNKQPLKIASDILEFMQFSDNLRNSDKDAVKCKKKRLSKQEAAVKPRKPPVVLRKAPVVKLSYQQDSDTNTDYSDSDMSTICTPKKTPLNRNKKQIGKNVSKGSRHSEEKETSSPFPSSDLENDCHKSLSVSKKQKQLKEREPSSCDDSDSEMEAEETNEVSDTASSVSSHTADLDKTTTHNPNLDFNIEGGVESLLKSQTGKADTVKWKINDQDRYQIPVTKSRYFSPLSLVCRNCNKEGHKALDCPEPKKSICIFCGKIGHTYQVCPDSLCHNCNEPGHRLADCQERPRGKRTVCDRCWMPGHFTEDCPDLWRQYHLTTGPDHKKIQTASKKHFNPKVYCFNCGKEGHLGYECHAQLMNFHVIPNYPFIAKYSTGECKENRNNNMNQKKKKVSKEKKNKRYQQDLDRKKSHNDMDYEEEYWEKKGSGRKKMGKSSHGSKRKGHSDQEENDKIYKNSRSESHQNIYTDKAGKLLIEIPNEDRSRGTKKTITTESTVFSYQTSFDQEEDYRPPMKKRLSQREKDYQSNWYRHHRSEQPPFIDFTTNQNHHEYDSAEGNDFRSHQVSRNEWWNEGQSTDHRKKGKNKSSRKNTTLKSKQTTKDNFRNDEMYSDDEMHHSHNDKGRKQTETYESSRKCVSSHKSHQSASSSTGKNDGRDRYHKHYDSGYQRYKKKKNKSGFQMNSHFQSLAKSCQRR